MNKATIKRNPFWDSLKFILIFIVVYGHMIETCVDNSRYNQAVYNFIYLFHMPLFVFISGHFSHIRDKHKYLSGMMSILETYFIFQLARCIQPVFSGGSVAIFPDLFVPKGILWYLACILLWRSIIVIANETLLNHNRWIVLSSFLIMGLGIGFIIVPDGTVIRFFALGFFFFLGYYLKETHLKKMFNMVPIWITTSTLLLLFFFVYFILNKDIRSVIYWGSFYDNPPTPPIYFFLARIFTYAFATITGFLIMRLVYAKCVLAKYGRYTLAIFMYHIFLVTTLRLLIANGTVPRHEIVLFAYAIVIFYLLVWLTQHFKIMTIMLNPITYFFSQFKTK